MWVLNLQNKKKCTYRVEYSIYNNFLTFYGLKSYILQALYVSAFYMTWRRGVRRKQLLNDLEGKKEYWKMKEEATRSPSVERLLTPNPLTWKIWWANNASRWQVGFNLAFKELTCHMTYHEMIVYVYFSLQSFCAAVTVPLFCIHVIRPDDG